MIMQVCRLRTARSRLGQNGAIGRVSAAAEFSNALVRQGYTCKLAGKRRPTTRRPAFDCYELELTVLTIFEPIVLAAVFKLDWITTITPIARTITAAASATHSS